MTHDGRTLGGGSGSPPPQQRVPPAAQAGQEPATSSGSGCVARPSSPPSPITLSVPRPEHQRASNLYVDTPFQHRVSSRRAGLLAHAGRPIELPLVHGTPGRSSTKKSSKASTASKSTSHHTQQHHAQHHQQKVPAASTRGAAAAATAVVKQPTALTFRKGGREDSEGESIICTWCGRCRCDACTTPRPPPATWLCADTCLCSPAAAVDYASCLCCVKCVLYHCSQEDEVLLVDEPCTCSGPDRCLRWACLAAATVPLPCLLCYWPLTGVRVFLEKIYQRCTIHGCRCTHGRTPPQHRPQAPTPEKRLLQDCS